MTIRNENYRDKEFGDATLSMHELDRINDLQSISKSPVQNIYNLIQQQKKNLMPWILLYNPELVSIIYMLNIKQIWCFMCYKATKKNWS